MNETIFNQAHETLFSTLLVRWSVTHLLFRRFFREVFASLLLRNGKRLILTHNTALIPSNTVLITLGVNPHLRRCTNFLHLLRRRRCYLQPWISDRPSRTKCSNLADGREFLKSIVMTFVYKRHSKHLTHDYVITSSDSLWENALKIQLSPKFY